MYERDLCKISATHQRSKRHWSWHTMNQVHRWPSMFIEVALVVLWQSEGPSCYRQHVSHSALANDLEFNWAFFRIKKSNFYYIMMTSSMETFSALLAHLCGELWIPRTKASDAELLNREAGDLRRYRAHYDVTVMFCEAVVLSSYYSI